MAPGHGEPHDGSMTATIDRPRPFAVAIMQPYFLPYAGYFRLFAASDLFVIYDCVQFPRRGWVHRNRLTDSHGIERWLTLPLEKAPRATPIKDLRFPPDAAAVFAERLRAFPLHTETREVQDIVEAVRDVRGSPLEYIERLLERIAGYLGLPWTAMRSSSLDVPADFRGQQRILEIVRRLGASRYVNAPGGAELYDGAAFADAGLELRILEQYPGPSSSILARLIQQPREELAADIRESVRFRPGQQLEAATVI